MEIIVKKTGDLSCDEQEQITLLFNRVFSKNETVSEFLKKYYWTRPEGSYHALMKVDGEVVGCYSVIPYEFRFFDKSLTFGLSVDTMIDSDYRGTPLNLKNMANALYDKLVLEGIPIVYAFPNDNVYLVRRKVLKWVDIGHLDFYMLPIRIGKLKSSLRYADWASRIFSYLMVQYARLISPKVAKAQSPNILMSQGGSKYFLSHRYEGDYKVVKDETGFFVYRTYVEDDALVAYIIDVQPLAQDRLERAVSTVYGNESHVDAIIYIGNPSFKVRNLIKIPDKYVPRTVRMSGRILDESKLDKRVYDMSNWQACLANIDVR